MSSQYEQVLSQYEADVEKGIVDAYRSEGYVDDDGNLSGAIQRAPAPTPIVEIKAWAAPATRRSDHAHATMA